MLRMQLPILCRQLLHMQASPDLVGMIIQNHKYHTLLLKTRFIFYGSVESVEFQ